MKKLVVIVLLISVYLWIASTGREQFVRDQGHRFFQTMSEWLDDSDVDIQIHRQILVQKKKPRRWD
jgi:hypothetical protein